MKEKTLQTLEFDKILALLAQEATFSAGREAALALRPSTDAAEIARRQQAAQEAAELLRRQPRLGAGQAIDVRPLARQAALGGVLTPQELQEIANTLAAVRTLSSTVRAFAPSVPVLAEIAEQLDACPELAAEIERCIGRRGEVLDGASPLLKRLRAETQTAHDRLIKALDGIVKAPRYRNALQEPVVTQREGRYVVPLKAEFRGRLRGVVHDTSATGATVFVEPLSTIDLGNRWRELRAEEEREVQRVLRRLSALAGDHAEMLERDVEVLGRLDLELAKARLGARLRATPATVVEPTAGGERRLLLREARHPLLTGEVVPISVEVGGDYRVLVITGPNTGGKTVVLKTIGLLSLMAQAGMPIPASEDSRLPLFTSVYADIGDEQSIEQSLSTFSSHMGNIIDILEGADEGSLVLLDELAAGTDPTEGSALARAILASLLERGSTTVATTHHSDLKAYAHATPGVMNASVEFDPETLAPTYHLSIGLPGRSNAIAIAERLGLAPELAEDARRFLTPTQSEIESLLSQIQADRMEAARSREQAAREAAAAEESRRELQERLAHIDEERKQAVSQTRDELSAEVEDIRRRLRRLLANVAATQEERRRLQESLLQAQDVERILAEPRWRPQSPPVAPERAADLAPGTRVLVKSLNQLGDVLAEPDAEGEVEVQVGALRARVRADDLEVRGKGPAGVASSPRSRIGNHPVALQIELRGRRADDVADDLERYLNDAFLAGLEQVRVVHGKGTGALRKVVRDHLANHPLVKNYDTAEPAEGGEGVTVVRLAV